MTNLDLIIRETQREAAALPTDELRTEIEVYLEVLDTMIGQFRIIRPGAGNLKELIRATNQVIIAALTTALYVRELTRRPAPRVVARIGFSRN